MNSQDMEVEKLKHMGVDIYEVLIMRVHKAMKDWGFTFTEALNLFLDWGSIHAVKYMERKRKERMKEQGKNKKETMYVN